MRVLLKQNLTRLASQTSYEIFGVSKLTQITEAGHLTTQECHQAHQETAI